MTAMPTDSHSNTFSKWENHVQICYSAWKLIEEKFFWDYSHWKKIQLRKFSKSQSYLYYVCKSL